MTVKQVSKLMAIPKDTLIYYDKLDIVTPNRGDNGYRLYSDRNIEELKYVEVCKQSGFSLHEIKRSLDQQKRPTAEGFQWHREFLREKKMQLRQKQKEIQAMLDLLAVTEDLMEQKLRSGSDDPGVMQALINQTFADMRRESK